MFKMVDTYSSIFSPIPMIPINTTTSSTSPTTTTKTLLQKLTRHPDSKRCEKRGRDGACIESNKTCDTRSWFNGVQRSKRLKVMIEDESDPEIQPSYSSDEQSASEDTGITSISQDTPWTAEEEAIFLHTIREDAYLHPSKSPRGSDFSTQMIPGSGNGGGSTMVHKRPTLSGLPSRSSTPDVHSKHARSVIASLHFRPSPPRTPSPHPSEGSAVGESPTNSALGELVEDQKRGDDSEREIEGCAECNSRLQANGSSPDSAQRQLPNSDAKLPSKNDFKKQLYSQFSRQTQSMRALRWRSCSPPLANFDSKASTLTRAISLPPTVAQTAASQRTHANSCCLDSPTHLSGGSQSRIFNKLCELRESRSPAQETTSAGRTSRAMTPIPSQKYPPSVCETDHRPVTFLSSDPTQEMEKQTRSAAIHGSVQSCSSPNRQAAGSSATSIKSAKFTPTNPGPSIRRVQSTSKLSSGTSTITIYEKNASSCSRRCSGESSKISHSPPPDEIDAWGAPEACGVIDLTGDDDGMCTMTVKGPAEATKTSIRFDRPSRVRSKRRRVIPSSKPKGSPEFALSTFHSALQDLSARRKASKAKMAAIRRSESLPAPKSRQPEAVIVCRSEERIRKPPLDNYGLERFQSDESDTAIVVQVPQKKTRKIGSRKGHGSKIRRQGGDEVDRFRERWRSSSNKQDPPALEWEADEDQMMGSGSAEANAVDQSFLFDPGSLSDIDALVGTNDGSDEEWTYEKRQNFLTQEESQNEGEDDTTHSTTSSATYSPSPMRDYSPQTSTLAYFSGPSYHEQCYLRPDANSRYRLFRKLEDICERYNCTFEDDDVVDIDKEVIETNGGFLDSMREGLEIGELWNEETQKDEREVISGSQKLSDVYRQSGETFLEYYVHPCASETYPAPPRMYSHPHEIMAGAPSAHPTAQDLSAPVAYDAVPDYYGMYPDMEGQYWVYPEEGWWRWNDGIEWEDETIKMET